MKKNLDNPNYGMKLGTLSYPIKKARALQLKLNLSSEEMYSNSQKSQS